MGRLPIRLLGPLGIACCLAAAVPAVPSASAASTRLVAEATTVDRDANGRIDAVRIEYSRPLAVSALGARRVIRVHGYSIIRVLPESPTRCEVRRARCARAIFVTLRERELRAGHTGSRPVISHVDGASGRRQWIRAADGARPSLLSVRGEDARTLQATWSEPVALRGGSFIVAASGKSYAAVVVRHRGKMVQLKLAQPLRQAVSSALGSLRLHSGAKIKDRAGNVARTTARTTVTARKPKPRKAGVPSTSPGAAAPVASADASASPSAASEGVALGTVANWLRDPFAEQHQTDLDFGERSHWLQPWRAYQETVSARRVVDGFGIVFNVGEHEAASYAATIRAAGFRRARYEVGWSDMSYEDPTRLQDPSRLRTVLRALKDNGIRPLLLLNANHGHPGPMRRSEVRVTGPAAEGDRRLTLDSASAASVVPGRTGLDSFTDNKAADILFTSVSGTVVTLSKPLPRDVGPGRFKVSTFRYRPFTRLGSAGFEETMAGWLAYVRAVTREARSILGSDAFDIEIWNEPFWASDFLDINAYYEPDIVDGGVEDNWDAILRRTVSFLRSPEGGAPGVGITNGFASQIPWSSGATSPPGLTANSKHLYAGKRVFPEDARFNGDRPLDALGRLDGISEGKDRWRDRFVPRYVSFFPEYYLTAIQTEHLVRDISPFTTDIYGTPHGRLTHPAGAAPPEVWFTEIGLDANTIEESGRGTQIVKAKMALRYLTSWLNKGLGAVYLFAAGDAHDGPYALVDPSAHQGGLVMQAVSRLSKALTPGAISQPRDVVLRGVGDSHNRVIFRGDGTPAHPNLYERDSIGFFPVQVSERRWVVPAYVITRDLTAAHEPSRFRLEIGFERAREASVSAVDPLTGDDVPLAIAGRGDATLQLDVELTDHPRLIVIETS
jgi:hypothetical protein